VKTLNIPYLPFYHLAGQHSIAIVEKKEEGFREGAKPPLLPNPLPFINTQGKGARG
jgi:hypothetical protein